MSFTAVPIQMQMGDGGGGGGGCFHVIKTFFTTGFKPGPQAVNTKTHTRNTLHA